MTFRVSKQYVSVPTVLGHDNIPDVGNPRYGSDVYQMDTVLGGPNMGVSRPDLVASNSLVHGVFRNPREIKISRLVARVANDDLESLMELALVCLEETVNPLRVSSIWEYEFISSGEIQSHRDLLNVGPWQSSASGRALFSAVLGLMERNANDPDVLLRLDDLVGEYQERLIQNACEAATLVELAIGDAAAASEKAYDFLSLVPTDLIDAELEHIREAREFGIDFNGPCWRIVLMRCKRTLEESLSGSDDVLSLAEADPLSRLTKAALERARSSLHEDAKLQAQIDFDQIMDIIISSPTQWAERMALMLDVDGEFDVGDESEVAISAEKLLKFIAQCGHERLPEALDILVSNVKSDINALEVLCEFSLTSDDVWKMLNEIDEEIFLASIERKPFVATYLFVTWVTNAIPKGAVLHSLSRAVEGVLLNSDPEILRYLADEGFEPAKRIVDGLEAEGKLPRMSAREALVKERHFKKRGDATVLPFKPLTDPE